MTQPYFNAGEMQRDYDRYRERHGLPPARVLDAQRDEFIAFSEEHQALWERYLATIEALGALHEAIMPRVGVEGTTVGDAITPAESARCRDLTREHMDLCEALGEPATWRLDANGEVYWRGA